MEKVLVLGGSGLVGKAIINGISESGDFEVYSTYFRSGITLDIGKSIKLDIENLDGIDRILNSIKPSKIVSCLRGDFDKQLILHRKVAEYLKANNGRLYFCSTANVFDADIEKPYYEDDTPNSCSDYGKFKIECEKMIIDILGDNSCILRFPQVWGKESPRFKQLLDSLLRNEEITIYPKLIYNAITDIDIAKKIEYIIKNNLKGTFHITADDEINHKEFYEELASGLRFHNVIFKEDMELKGHFSLLSIKNNEFPQEYTVNNKSIINYLINNHK